MAIQNVALSAYRSQLKVGDQLGQQSGSSALKKNKESEGSGFSASLQNSLKTVNDLQTKKADMIESFASGESENVHELMITLQKAGVAMSMTSAVRNKVLESYKELMRLSF
jgi:flagellar hook-basal body complex protein FliE